MSNYKVPLEFYKGFPKAVEKKIRDCGPSQLSAADLAELAPVRDVVALALTNGVVKPESEPGRLSFV